MKSRVVFLLAAVGLLLGQSVFGVQLLIKDGGFETPLGSQGPWDEGGSSQLGIFFVDNSAQAHSGSGYLSMGNSGGPATQVVFQTNTVPTNTVLLQLSYFWGMASTDVSGDILFSSFLIDSNALVTYDLDNVANTFNSSTGGYVQSAFQFTNTFNGHLTSLAFQMQMFQAGVGANTFVDIDDVSLVAWTTDDIPPNDYFTNSTSLGESAGITVVGTNVLATKESGEPNIAGNSGGHSLWWHWTAQTNGVVSLNTSGSSFNTLLGVYTGNSVSNLTPVTSNDSGGTDSKVKFAAFAGTTYQIAIDGRNGATGLAQLTLSFVPDVIPPKITIKSPAAKAKLTNSTVTVLGTASDDVAVAFLQFRLENDQGTNDYQNANGTTNWSATVTNLFPGTNTIRIRAYDLSSNVTTVALPVTYIVVSPLTLIISGTGTVSPDLTNAPLVVGATYTLTAKPGTGEVFSNWMVTNLVVITPVFTFTMESNMVLNVNFVPNPFIPVAGVYDGLFFDTNGPQHESSGFFNAAVTSSGSYSAKIIVAGISYSLSGQFSAGGMASNNIVRKAPLAPVSVQLQLDLGGGGITGLFSSTDPWLAELYAQRPMTNAAAFAGHYTLLIPGADSGEEQPGGDGYGSVAITSTGGLSLAGVLADGSKVSQKALLLNNGQWPFYLPLYTGKGSILGWLTFSNQPDSDITGTVDWFKPALPGAFYPGGFTNASDAVGSIYQFTNGVPVLNLSTGIVWFANGNLASSFTNKVALSAANKVTNLSSNNALALTLTTSTGLFKVTAVNPANGKSITGGGVVLQKQSSGGGSFLGTNQAGRVFWGP